MSPSTAAKDSPASESVRGLGRGKKVLGWSKCFPPAFLGGSRGSRSSCIAVPWDRRGAGGGGSISWLCTVGVIKSEMVFYRVLPLLPAPGIKYLNPDTRFSWNNHTMVSEARSQSGAAQAGAACAGSSGQAGLLPGLVRGGRCTRRFNAHLDEQRPKRHKGGYICGCKSGTGCKTLLPGQGGEQRPAMPCKDSRGWMHTRLLINTPDTHYKKNQAEPQLNTNCKPSRWRGERQGPPTLLAE